MSEEAKSEEQSTPEAGPTPGQSLFNALVAHQVKDTEAKYLTELVKDHLREMRGYDESICNLQYFHVAALCLGSNEIASILLDANQKAMLKDISRSAHTKFIDIITIGPNNTMVAAELYNAAGEVRF